MLPGLGGARFACRFVDARISEHIMIFLLKFIGVYLVLTLFQVLAAGFFDPLFFNCVGGAKKGRALLGICSALNQAL